MTMRTLIVVGLLGLAAIAFVPAPASAMNPACGEPLRGACNIVLQCSDPFDDHGGYAHACQWAKGKVFDTQQRACQTVRPFVPYPVNLDCGPYLM
jgi:hypothetical protein